MTDGFTERLQQTRLMVVEVDRLRGRLRVKGEGCTDLSCHDQTIVVTEDGTITDADLQRLFDGEGVLGVGGEACAESGDAGHRRTS